MYLLSFYFAVLSRKYCICHYPIIAKLAKKTSFLHIPTHKYSIFCIYKQIECLTFVCKYGYIINSFCLFYRALAYQ